MSSAQKPKIATIGSHSALQILKGAHDEGFETIAICKKGSEYPYKSFGVADEIISVDSFAEIMDMEADLQKKNAIIIPHGSFIAHMGIDKVEQLKTAYFGTKKILEWESDRGKEREWLLAAGLKLPRIFENPSDIDRPVIVKFFGAQGGKGYFIAKNEKDFTEKIKAHTNPKYVIQEYIVGVPLFIHYFYSPLTKELEIMSFDIRYESNVDSLGRISARDQIALPQIDPSYVIVGNIPAVVRESYLPRFFEMGMNVVKESQKIAGRGLFGPFCLEMILTPDQDVYVFEISARIVAGSNPYVGGSPYADLKYDVPMSTGRRIALEIKRAMEQDRMDEVTE